MRYSRRAALACMLAATALVQMPAAWAQDAKTIQVSALIEQTGAIAYAGQAVLQGMELAVDELNRSGKLAPYALKLDVKDAASNPATAAALAAQIAKSPSLALLGPALSNDALAVAPIAQREKLPMVAIQSNTRGLIETGDHIYRLTAPFFTFNGLTIRYLKEQGVKKLALSYPSDVASTSELSKVFIPKWAEAEGMEIVSAEASPRTATDFSAVISKLVSQEPDAIGLMNLDTQLPALVTGLRRAGFKGYLFTHSIGPATLKAIGAPADGMLNSLDFSPAMTEASSVAFTKAFTERFGSTPYNYNANGYDAVMFISAALEKLIAAGKTPDREALLASLSEVAQGAFVGASGEVRFDEKLHRDARIAGVLVRFSNGGPEVIKTGKAGLEEQ